MNRPALELSMIVKNGGATLARCLASARGTVDRILIGDTGSTDDTLEIAARFGAEVIHLPPITVESGFSAARNAVLQHSRARVAPSGSDQDWILVLDADEMLDPADATLIHRLIEHPEIFAYEAWRWNYVTQTNSRCVDEGALPNPGGLPEAAAYPAFVRSLSTRLFRRHPGIFFERPVHENVTSSVQALGLPIAPAPFIIHHLGHAEDLTQVRNSKNEFYHALGRAHFEANPDDAHTCFELGLGELEHFKRPERALDLFLRAIALKPFDSVEASNAFLYAGICLIRLERYSAALDALARAYTVRPGSIVLLEAIGDAYFHQSIYTSALHAYTAAQDCGGTSALLAAKRGLCEIHLGDPASGVSRLKDALAADPGFPELYDVVVLGAVLSNDIEFAASAAEQRLTLPNPSPEQLQVATTLRQMAPQRAASTPKPPRAEVGFYDRELSLAAER